MGDVVLSKLHKVAKKSSDAEIDIANKMDIVLGRQCRIDDIEVQLAKGVLHLYDAQDNVYLTGQPAYDYYLDCISGLVPSTEESLEIEAYFVANPVKSPVERKKWNLKL